MKYIITENKMENVVIKYLNKMYGDLEEYRTDKRPNRVFFVKGKKVYMELRLERELLYVDYDTIWSELTDTFLLEYDEIQSIITKWVEETYNLRYVTPHEQLPIDKIRWDKLIK
jgi:hypothetical protein